MATMFWVYQCSGAKGVAVDPVDMMARPTCAANEGSWIEVDVSDLYSNQPFNPDTLSKPELLSAFSFGFVALGIPLAVVWGVRQLLDMLGWAPK